MTSDYEWDIEAPPTFFECFWVLFLQIEPTLFLKCLRVVNHIQ
jgi:hypothetical protein